MRSSGMRETWPAHLSWALGMTMMALGRSACFSTSVSEDVCVLVVSGCRAKSFQGSGVNCVPDGCPFLFNTFKIGLEVLEFVVQV